MRWIQPNCQEIKQSLSLILFGMFLSLFHVIISFLWSSLDFTHREFALCWEFFPSCQGWQAFVGGGFSYLMTVYKVLAILSFLSFASGRIIGVAWYCLLASTFIKVVIYFTYWELIDNIHVFLWVLEFGFLFILQKKRTLKILVIATYLFSGLLNLNSDWLSGFWLSSQFDLLPTKATEWIAAILVAIELTVPLVLLSATLKRFILAIFILFIYHWFYWIYISPWMSVAQIGGLIFLIFDFYEVRKKRREYNYQPSYASPEPGYGGTFMILMLFGVIQLLPVWNATLIPKNFPLRFQPYKALVNCKQYSFIKFKQSLIDPGPTEMMVSCHPEIYFHRGRELCRQYSSKEDFVGVSSYFAVKHSASYESQFEFENICSVDSLSKEEP